MLQYFTDEKSTINGLVRSDNKVLTIVDWVLRHHMASQGHNELNMFLFMAARAH